MVDKTHQPTRHHPLPRRPAPWEAPPSRRNRINAQGAIYIWVMYGPLREDHPASRFRHYAVVRPRLCTRCPDGCSYKAGRGLCCRIAPGSLTTSSLYVGPAQRAKLCASPSRMGISLKPIVLRGGIAPTGGTRELRPELSPGVHSTLDMGNQHGRGTDEPNCCCAAQHKIAIKQLDPYRPWLQDVLDPPACLRVGVASFLLRCAARTTILS